MGVLRVTGFSGRWPSRDVRGLPDNAALTATNLDLKGGMYARPLNNDQDIKALGDNTKSVYRLPLVSNNEAWTSSRWMEFDDIDTDVARALIVNDSFQRIYWASPSTGLRFRSRADILAGGVAPTGLNVGVTPPVVAPLLTITPGTGELDPATGLNVKPKVTRSYVVTFVNIYGEESAPSPPVEGTGAPDQTWVLSSIPQPVADATRAAPQYVRLYRTVTGDTALTQFYLVIELFLGSTVYGDTLTDLVVTSKTALETAAWAVPLASLQGLVAMPNGIFVSWKDNNLYFSEDYRPHAWPAEYTLTVDFPIVGLGVFGSTCVVCTTGNPSLVTGITASSMTLTKVDAPFPCLSRRSIVSAPEGVYFATNGGLALIGPNGLEIVTSRVISEDNWQNTFFPSDIRAAYSKGVYHGTVFQRAPEGFMISPATMEQGLVDVTLSDPINIGTDPWTGRLWYIREQVTNNRLLEYQKIGVAGRAFEWVSKEFKLPKPVNFKVFEILFDDDANDIDLSVRLRVWVYLRGNDGAVAKTLMYDELVTVSGQPVRLPDGFRGDVWQFSIVSTKRVQEVIFASSVAELRGS